MRGRAIVSCNIWWTLMSTEKGLRVGHVESPPSLKSNAFELFYPRKRNISSSNIADASKAQYPIVPKQL